MSFLLPSGPDALSRRNLLAGDRNADSHESLRINLRFEIIWEALITLHKSISHAIFRANISVRGSARIRTHDLKYRMTPPHHQAIASLVTRDEIGYF